MNKLFKNMMTNNQSGIALVTAIVAVVATTTIVGLSLFSFFFSDKNKEKETDTEVTSIITQIHDEISEIEIPQDRKGLYDFEIEHILKRYGTINYNWLKRIKSITLPDGTTIDIKDIYSGKIIKSSVKEQYEGGVYNKSAKIETPILGEDMIGVYWSDGEKNNDGTYKASTTSTEIEVTSDKNSFSWSDWYDYIDTTNAHNSDTKLNRWANAKNKTDGSYFVWIPRFEYKLTNEHSNKAGTITINFISTSQTSPSNSEYKIHPAFINGNGNYNKGEWDAEISGFWVAKYEMSMETSKNKKNWESIPAEYITSSTKGNVLTSSVIKDENKDKKYIRTVSKPNCYSWNYIGIDNAYSNSKLYDEKNQSHLIKNSEWGAVAYLTTSQYGRNSSPIGMNTYYHSVYGFSKLTGYGSDNTTATANIKNINKYDSSSGMNASTTGNIYGIYDMNGANFEYTAGYFSQQENVIKYGQSLLIDTNNSTQSSKFVTIYPGEKASISANYESWNEIYGDAIYETSSGTGSSSSWFSNSSDIDSIEKEPFILRGGSYRDGSSAGLFSFEDNEGTVYYNNNGFRVILIPQQ